MLAALLARYSAHGRREVDRYAAWLAAVQQLRDDWENGEHPDVKRLRNHLAGIPEDQRADALQDLIGEHLQLTWQVGRGTRLEEYSAEFGREDAPLASLATVPVELVEDEFLARYQLPHGDMPRASAYQQRFRARADVMELLGRRCLDGGRFVKLHKRGLGAFGEVWEAHDHGCSHSRGADFQSAVSQRFQPAEAAESKARAETEAPCRLEIGDTAGWKPALPARRVAIKEPRADLPDKSEAFRRFAEEARATAGLEHPGIVTMREHQPSDGSAPFYVMRLVNGETLGQRIRDFHLPPPDRTPSEQRQRWNHLLECFVMICDAMEHAHARGVLHRDLKPGNIVVEPPRSVSDLSPSPLNGERAGVRGETVRSLSSSEPVAAVILDWGMATRQSSAGELRVQSDTREVVGTPDYMPPEQLDGIADVRSDVFSLGAILYEILTGRSPHGWTDGARPADWQRLVREAQFPPPRQSRPQTPPALESICLKALARNPESRYQSAAKLAADLRRHLAGDSVSACRQSAWARLLPWLRGAS
jgi:serine/threonine protein kinase